MLCTRGADDTQTSLLTTHCTLLSQLEQPPMRKGVGVQGSTLRGPSQPEMRALLEMLLAPEEDSPVTAKVLATRIPDTGVTLLGHAVAWGYADALPPLLDAVRCDIPLVKAQISNTLCLHLQILWGTAAASGCRQPQQSCMCRMSLMAWQLASQLDAMKMLLAVLLNPHRHASGD